MLRSGSGAPGEVEPREEAEAPTVLAVLPSALWAEPLLGSCCSDGACQWVRAADPATARRFAARQTPDVVVWGYVSLPTDVSLSESLAGLLAIKALHPDTEIIAVVADEQPVPLQAYCQLITIGVRSLVDACRPDAAETLAARVAECLAIHRDEREARSLLRESPLLHDLGLVGDSLIDRGILSLVQRAAMLSDVPVLIVGETGTGKRLLAEAVHRFDQKRRDHPMLVVNCAAVAEGLAESALFGHRQGAFTGASADRAGYFRAADRGTLFLDEIGELPLALQAKLLRVLEVGRVMPVGEDVEHPVDVRVIAASNRSLTDMVAEGTFRVDLYHRLSIIRIEVPPLRDRPEDIPDLLQSFVDKYAHYYDGRIDQIEPVVIDLLRALPNPGNVREVENVVRYALLTKRVGSTLHLSDLPPGLIREGASAQQRPGPGTLLDYFRLLLLQDGMSLTDMVDYCEQMILSAALQMAGQNRTRAAELLHTTRRTIQNKLLKHHLT